MSSPIQSVRKIKAAFAKHGIDYLVGGSVASSALGNPRLTHDIDLVSSLSPHHAQLIMDELKVDFYG